MKEGWGRWGVNNRRLGTNRSRKAACAFVYFLVSSRCKVYRMDGLPTGTEFANQTISPSKILLTPG